MRESVILGALFVTTFVLMLCAASPVAALAVALVACGLITGAFGWPRC